jgi:hypothetical protein
VFPVFPNIENWNARSFPHENFKWDISEECAIETSAAKAGSFCSNYVVAKATTQNDSSLLTRILKSVQPPTRDEKKLNFQRAAA